MTKFIPLVREQLYWPTIYLDPPIMKQNITGKTMRHTKIILTSAVPKVLTNPQLTTMTSLRFHPPQAKSEIILMMFLFPVMTRILTDNRNKQVQG